MGDSVITRIFFFIGYLIAFSSFSILGPNLVKANEIYKHTDENGRVVFTNIIPQGGGGSSPGVKTLQSEVPQVNQYYDYVRFLQKESSRLTRQALPEKEDIEKYVSLLPNLDELMDKQGKMPAAVFAKTRPFEDMAEKLKSASQGNSLTNKVESFMLISQGQFCHGLATKVMIESFFDEKNITYQRMEVNDQACFSDFIVANGPLGNEKATSTTTSIRDYCRAEWENDYRMLEYCIEKQSKSLNKIKSIRGQIADDCREQWKNDHRMTEYCIEKQSEAKKRLGM